jgi:hypothetical protein
VCRVTQVGPAAAAAARLKYEADRADIALRAAADGNIADLQLLLLRGCSPDVADYDQRTVLMLGAAKGHKVRGGKGRDKGCCWQWWEGWGYVWRQSLMITYLPLCVRCPRAANRKAGAPTFNVTPGCQAALLHAAPLVCVLVQRPLLSFTISSV